MLSHSMCSHAFAMSSFDSMFAFCRRIDFVFNRNIIVLQLMKRMMHNIHIFCLQCVISYILPSKIVLFVFCCWWMDHIFSPFSLESQKSCFINNNDQVQTNFAFFYAFVSLHKPRVEPNLLHFEWMKPFCISCVLIFIFLVLIPFIIKKDFFFCSFLFHEISKNKQNFWIFPVLGIRKGERLKVNAEVIDRQRSIFHFQCCIQFDSNSSEFRARSQNIELKQTECNNAYIVLDAHMLKRDTNSAKQNKKKTEKWNLNKMHSILDGFSRENYWSFSLNFQRNAYQNDLNAFSSLAFSSQQFNILYFRMNFQIIFDWQLTQLLFIILLLGKWSKT